MIREYIEAILGAAALFGLLYVGMMVTRGL